MKIFGTNVENRQDNSINFESGGKLFDNFFLSVMFGLCSCIGGKSRKDHIDRNSKHYAQVQKNLSEQEQVMLELIYNDLAIRNKDKLLTYENFLLFFGLTGLWGAKLFRQFDEDGKKLISKEEFFYGLSRTAKAAYTDKVKLLFNFFKDDHDNGIKLSAFTKMLYNYSKDDLKEILVEDLSESPELSKQIHSRTHSCKQPCKLFSSTQLIKTNRPRTPLLKSNRSQSMRNSPVSHVIELDYQEIEVPREDETIFGRHYAKFSEYKDPGTILELKMNDFTYKVNYCNMITLVKQFAKNIYKNYKIDPKNGIFKFDQFQEWIRSHNKLFETYYTSFHINLWTYFDGEPNFLHKLQKSFTAKTVSDGKLKTIYAMLSGDILIVAENKKQRKFPTKVICLDGLDMQDLRDQNGYGIKLSHRDEYYPSFIIYLENKNEQTVILDLFRRFEGDTLYDLYVVHEMIGTGKFSIVYRCTDKDTGKTYALKDISTQKLSAKQEAMFDNQSQIMKILSHPQIVKYNTTIRSKEHIYIVAELVCGKNLDEYVRRKGRLTEYISAFLIGKIIEAVRYLHSLQIIHRDLKPENIMVMFKKHKHGEIQSEHDNIQNIKIIDFGLANHQSEINSGQVHGLAGTPNYIAPEIILNNKTSCKSDTFSIGSILYFLLSGNLAFAYKNVEYTLLRTARGQYDLSGDPWDKISDEAIDLVKKLLDPDPETRIDLGEALNHRWFEVVTGRMKESQELKMKKQRNSGTTSRSMSSEGQLYMNCGNHSPDKVQTQDIELVIQQKPVEKLRRKQVNYRN